MDKLPNPECKQKSVTMESLHSEPVIYRERRNEYFQNGSQPENNRINSENLSPFSPSFSLNLSPFANSAFKSMYESRKAMENKPPFNPRRFNVDISNRPPINNPRIGKGNQSSIPAKFEKSRNVRRVPQFVPPNPRPEIMMKEYGASPMTPLASDSVRALNPKKIPAACFDKRRENMREMASGWSFGHGSTKEDTSEKGSAKSLLFETCVANRWQPPLFQCCQEEGPSHARKYRFKVIVEMKGAVLECYGNLHTRKKVAAEHAAEGALWYIKQSKT